MRVRAGTRPRVIAAFALAVVVSAVWLFRPTAASGASDVLGSIDAETFDRTQHLTGGALRDALGIPLLSWSKADDGTIVLSTPEGYEHLEDCGEALGALRSVFGDGSALCIPGAAASAEASFRAASAVLRVAQDRLPSETEIAIIRVESQLAFVDPESEEHDELLTELFALEKALTRAEEAVIDEARAKLVVD